MKITVENEKTLQIEEHNIFTVLFAFILVVFFITKLVSFIFYHESSLRQYIGVILGLLVSFGAGNAFSEKITFQFNQYEKAVRWSKKKAIGSGQSGIIPFGDIIKVNLGTLYMGQDAKYRIELVCRNQTIPVSAVYELGKKVEHEQMIKKIVEFIK